jgi:superoxide dismutase, Fe-Mn family
MVREIKKYTNLLGGALVGISDEQLEAHFGLYEGYVKKLNEIEEKLKTVPPSLSNYSFGEYSELKRRFTVPYNGTYLHEAYFENLVAHGEPSAMFVGMATESYGSLEQWWNDVKATGLAVPGWVVTCLETTTDKLVNIQVMEHHIGFPVNHVPVLVLDTWEHAFFLDYKTNRGGYIDVFYKNINWTVVNQRLSKITK